MKLNIELNQKDLEKLYSIYTKIKPLLQKDNAVEEQVVYDLSCDDCASSWEVSYIEYEDSTQPSYCPFCGVDIDLTDVEEESEDDFTIDELNFERDY